MTKRLLDRIKILSFEVKIGCCLTVLMAAVITLISISRFSATHLFKEQEQLIDLYEHKLRLVYELRYAAASAASAGPLYVLTGKSHFLERRQEYHVYFFSILEKLQLLLTDEADKNTLKELKALKNEQIKRNQPGFDLRRSGHSLVEVQQFLQTNARGIGETIRMKITQFHTKIIAEYENLRKSSARNISRIFNLLTYLSFLIFFVFIAVAIQMIVLLRNKKKADKERERLYEKIKHLSDSRKSMLEIVSHDLQNPLAAISLILQMLLEAKDLSQSAIKQNIERTLLSTTAMKNLVQNILSNSSIEAGGFTLDLKNSSIESLIVEVTNLYEPLAAQKAIKVVFNFSKGMPNFSFDLQHLRQAISNILGNAIKFTPKGGEIVISSDFNAPDIHISISDTGPGIPKPELSYIFNRFWQARTTARHGTGLGLTIAKSIIDAHGGRIWAESQVGAGTTFWISLPTKITA